MQHDKPVLAVDLDGTLIRSDMLLEAFWAGFARDARTPLRAALALAGGRAALKQRLAELAPPDPATLPYNETVLDEIRAARAQGRQVALVTAADQTQAQAIADHLGLFDIVQGSDGSRNLKGPAKADWLAERFGRFAYMGDHAADLAVWRRAEEAISVGAGSVLRARLNAIHPEARHIDPARPVLPAMLRAMRPHQWLKNLLVFFPMIAAHGWDAPHLLGGVLAFVAFSLVASSVYLLNDLLDLAADRAHPRKCRRPLASGALPIGRGMAMIPVLLGGGLVLGLALNPVFLLVLAGYYGLTLAYSLRLKRKALVDICVLALLYVARVIGGAAAMGIAPSVWLLAFSAFLFLALAAVKRLAELVDMQERGQYSASGRGYMLSDLPVVGQIATSSGFVAVLVLMLYLNEPEVLLLYNRPMLLWAACLALLYWVARMVLKAQRGEMNDDPIVFAARDRVSLITVVVVAALFAAAVAL